MGRYKPRVFCLDAQAITSSSTFRYLRGLVPESTERVKFGGAALADGVKLPKKFTGM